MQNQYITSVADFIPFYAGLQQLDQQIQHKRSKANTAMTKYLPQKLSLAASAKISAKILTTTRRYKYTWQLVV